MASLELRIPPPVVALVFALLIWLSSFLTPAYPFPLSARLAIASGIALLGLAVTFSGMIAFRRAKTTINPFTPTATTSLVSNGIYRITRNPMYVGLLLVLTGWAVYVSSLSGALLLPLFVLYIHQFQIKPEERVLASIFGADYDAYKARVGRWL